MLSWHTKIFQSNPRRAVIGLMSGTSLDALDAALLRETDNGCVELIHGETTSFPDALKQRLQNIVSSGEVRLKELLEVEYLYTKAVVTQCREMASTSRYPIACIGFHGQTLWHAPELASTLQIGLSEKLAEETCIPVVSQFRRSDMARGGQGAPLAPLFHAAHFGKSTESIVALNLGGIANLTIITPGQPLRGWDAGPANTLSDLWCQAETQKPFDHNGDFANQGSTNKKLLQLMLADPYFKRQPPKSTGREYFNRAWLDQFLSLFPGITGADVQATLNHLTADVIAKNIPTGTDLVVASGGGVHNAHLMNAIDEALDPLMVTSSFFGFDPNYVESACFGWLALKCLDGKILDVKSVTGADRNGTLGMIYRPAKD
ncbi:anhydro-N-acetylmuramic acid kinase [Litorivicinus sp.]|nr:anhydro-N-acetylmuramic acid kinase [Litorivicinus sp.]